MEDNKDALVRRVEELERRLANAEEKLGLLTAAVLLRDEPGSTLRAPLRVVDSDERVLLEVYRQTAHPFANELRLFDEQGHAGASLGALQEGGFLAIRDDTGHLIGYLSSETYGARMEILNRHKEEGVILFGQEQGGGINIISENSSIGLWTTDDGSQITISNEHPPRRVLSVFVGAKDDSVSILHQGKSKTL